MVTSDMLLRLITDLQRDVTARQGRRTLLEYISVSSGARLALLFVVDKEHEVLSLLDRWGRRSHGPTPPGEKTQDKQIRSRIIPVTGLFGSVLGQQGLLYVENATADPRILPEERSWIGRFQRLILSVIGEQQGVMVLCFEPEYTPRLVNDPLAVPSESNLLISGALLSAYLSSNEESIPIRTPRISPSSETTSIPTTSVDYQQLLTRIEQLAQGYEQRLQTAIEQERNRIAQNIHDSVAQQIADVLYKLEFIQRILDKQPDVAQQEISRLSEILKESLHTLRYNISALMPSELEQQGFETALRNLMDEYRRTEPALKIDYEGEATSLIPPSLETPIYGFIQEALQNVRKHAHASHVTIRIRVSAGMLLIEISDNGQGFDMAQVMNKQATGSDYSIGLRTMRNRVQQAGGSWEIQSKPGGGTNVKARFRLARHPGTLTNREREVLRLMAEGLTNRAIAEKLSVSTETIKSHVHHIMQKLHVNDRTQAAVIAARQQWL
ncbi:MAG: hybrid sensor histidine kinase/response regulator transcription factor [Ktedonobacteraceae bacterium]